MIILLHYLESGTTLACSYSGSINHYSALRENCAAQKKKDSKKEKEFGIFGIIDFGNIHNLISAA